METMRPLPIDVVACRCGKQPQHVLVHAHERHYLECAPCALRSARFGALDLAIEDWELLQRRAEVPA
jgi:hypothetical protein